MSVTNTMLEAMSEDLGLDEDVGGAVAAAALYVGAVLGGFLVGLFDRFSGRFAQFWIGLLFVLATFLCGLTTEHKICWGGAFDGCVAILLLAGRILAGIAMGLVIVISPKYLVTATSPKIRGCLLASMQLVVATGQFLGLVVGLPYEFDDDYDLGYEWWRIMFLSTTVPAILQCLSALLLMYQNEQSSKDLMNSSASDVAEKVVEVQIADQSSSIHPSSVEASHSSEKEVDMSTRGASSASEAQYNLPPPTQEPHTCTEQFWSLCEERYRHCVILALGIPIFCQASGVNVLVAYSTKVFEDAGMDKPIIGSAMFGLANIISSSFALWSYDHFGRRKTTRFSVSIMIVCYLVIALIDLASSTVSGIVSAVFVTVFIMAFSSSCGPMNITYAAEVVPPEIAPVALGLGQGLSLMVILVLVLVFPAILDAIGALLSFSFFLVVCIAFLVFLQIYLVETKGRDPQEIWDAIACP